MIEGDIGKGRCPLSEILSVASALMSVVKEAAKAVWAGADI